jgi:hypothetical protein
MFDYSKIEEIIKNYLEEEDEDIQDNFRGGASEEQLLEVEKILNINLPDSYRWFLKKYGSGGIAGININGIEAKQNVLYDCTLVYATNYYHEKFQVDKKYIVIEVCGDYIMCLDTSENNNKEYPVIMYTTHGEVDISRKKENFYDYFLDKLLYMTE